MVTMVIVFEELNRVVSLSPTKERMKANLPGYDTLTHIRPSRV